MINKDIDILKKYNKAPLPFQGQKRNFIKLFNEQLKKMCGDGGGWTIVDVFGGSGLLSHNAKYTCRNARVIYNDYDNYSRRLANINKTEEVRQNLLLLINDNNKNKLSADIRNKIIKYLKSENEVDLISISSYLLFSGNVTKNINEIEGMELYNRVPVTPINCDGYLKGVEVVRKCFTELMQDKFSGNVLYLLDPPYINTQQNYKIGYFGFLSQIRLMELIKPPFIYFTSEKSEIADIENVKRTSFNKIFDGCKVVKIKTQINKRSSYQDVMILKQ